LSGREEAEAAERTMIEQVNGEGEGGWGQRPNITIVMVLNQKTATSHVARSV